MTKHICLIAGEPSGDVLGARLMRDLKAKGGAIRFSGVGGPMMAAEGLQSLFPMTDLSVMGIAEVLPRLPLLMRRIKQTATHILSEKPDVTVTIDSPDFSFRVAKKVARAVPMVHYVAPTVWAWRAERAAKVEALYDGLMCLFPFESPYFKNMKTAFVGHPVLDTFAGMKHTGSGGKTLGLFFGSRMGELNRTGPVLREAALRLIKAHPGMAIVTPTLPHLEREVANLLRGIPGRSIIITDPILKYEAFATMDVALATSGTVGLELAVAGVPHVIAYKMSPMTWRVVKKKVKTPYAHLANILLDRREVPEFIQDACTTDNLYTAASALLDGHEQAFAFEQVRGFLKGRDDAASFVLGFSSP